LQHEDVILANLFLRTFLTFKKASKFTLNENPIDWPSNFSAARSELCIEDRHESVSLGADPETGARS
jgi:hypothetical protein